VGPPHVAQIDVTGCGWCSDVARLTAIRPMNEEQVERFAGVAQIFLSEMSQALRQESSDASAGCWDWLALVEMKVPAWTDAQESARGERARTLDLTKSDARLGKLQALEQAQVWRLAYLSQVVPYSRPCCGPVPADYLTVAAAC